MKLTILGGGGFRVPLVHRALLADEGPGRVTDLVLHDLDPVRLRTVAAVLADAEAAARRSEHDARNGRALAALILSTEGLVVDHESGYVLVELPEGKEDPDLRRRYVDAARMLFPDALKRGSDED